MVEVALSNTHALATPHVPDIFVVSVWSCTCQDAYDPYDLLPKLFNELDLSEEKIELLFSDDKLKEGGSASIAYARMQFTEMSGQERSELRNALLKYCELDTLAMVMIVEAWKHMVFGK